MEVQISGLLKPGQTPDFTRNGVAIGYVVVPEFPSAISTTLIVAAMLGTLIVLQRVNSRKNTGQEDIIRDRKRTSRRRFLENIEI